MTQTQEEHNRPIREQRMQDFLAYALSQGIAQTTGAKPNQCFDNVWEMFLCSFPELFYPYGKFIEGWYVVDTPDAVIMNEHGWCLLPGGTIVDPTVPLMMPPSQPVYYFPGVIRTWKEVATLALEGCSLPYVRFDGKHGKDGLGHPEYKAAHDAARQKVVQLATATTPPKKQVYLQAQDNPPKPKVSMHFFIFPPVE